MPASVKRSPWFGSPAVMTSCRGCRTLPGDDSLLPERRWHGRCCSICHCLNCNGPSDVRGCMPRRGCMLSQQFAQKSRTRRALALSRQRRRARVASADSPSEVAVTLVPQVDVQQLTYAGLLCYQSLLLASLRTVAEELRRRFEARFNCFRYCTLFIPW